MLSPILLYGGFIIARKNEPVADNRGFTCPNPSCGRTFPKPLKAINLGSKEAEHYLACPRCLTGITSEEPSSILESEPNQEANKNEERIVQAIEEKTAEPTPKPQCGHHFGYLSERSNKEQIPEDCMICENILNCMLKNVRG